MKTPMENEKWDVGAETQKLYLSLYDPYSEVELPDLINYSLCKAFAAGKAEGGDMVPRSRLDAMEIELGIAEKKLSAIQTAARIEIERLQKQIDEAPHGDLCDRGYDPRTGITDPCDCWKSGGGK